MPSPKRTRPASGTRDFSGRELARRRAALAVIEHRFAAHGFTALETPAFEPLEVLTGLYGEEGEKLVFKILKRGEGGRAGEADLALRYDLTVPAARAVAETGAGEGGFRRSQIGPVWRAERAGKGRFREFWQCDVDLYAVPAPAAEAETVAALAGALEDLELKGVLAAFSSRPLLKEICALYQLEAGEERAVLTALDKLDRITAKEAGEEIRCGAGSKGATRLAGELEEAGAEAFSARLLEAPALRDGAALAELEETRAAVAAAAGPGLGLELRPLLVRGLDYYTGFIFELFSSGSPLALGGGGRYDGLMEAVSGRPLPVCGGSLGFERILLQLEEASAEAGGAVPAWEGQALAAPERVAHLALFSEELRGETQALARRLRAAGALVFTESHGKLSAQLKRADKAGRRWALLYGPEEAAAGRVRVKDLHDGSQTAFAIGGEEELALLVRFLAAGARQQHP